MSSLPDQELELIERYFAGDLDAVERMEFERRLDTYQELKNTFESEYDRRTEEMGLLALSAPRAQIRECFSSPTLTRMAEGSLGAEATAMVEAHLDCPLCHAEYQTLVAQVQQQGAKSIVSEKQTSWWQKLFDGLKARPIPALATAFACIFLLSIQLYPKSSFRGGEEISVRLHCPEEWKVINGAPELACTPGDSLSISLKNDSAKARAFAVALGNKRPVFLKASTSDASNKEALPLLKPNQTLKVPIPHQNDEIYLHLVVLEHPVSLTELQEAWPARLKPGHPLGLALEGKPQLKSVHLVRK